MSFMENGERRLTLSGRRVSLDVFVVLLGASLSLGVTGDEYL